MMEKFISPEAPFLLPRQRTSERRQQETGHKVNLSQVKTPAILSEKFGHVFSMSEGTPIKEEKQEEAGFRIKMTDGTVTIYYHDEIDKFRALGEIATHGAVEQQQKPLFEERSLMLDVSRNAVMKPDAVLHDLLPRLALMGINQLVLYAEDTIYDSDHPKIGYQRGAYTKEEIQQMVASAKEFGIEVVPAIQTLSHLSHVLKHREYRHLAENYVTLNPGAAGYEEFVKQRIKHAAEVFGTNKVHIGGDEPEGLGRGRSAKDGQTIQRLTLFQKYLAIVSHITDELGIEARMWGDVLTGMYGHPNLLETDMAFPNNVQVDIWEYENENVEDYLAQLSAAARKGLEPRAVMGLHTWNRMVPAMHNYTKTAYPFLEAAGKTGTKKVMGTIWGDDGHECPKTSLIPMLYDFAEKTYSGQDADEKLFAIEQLTASHVRSLDKVTGPECEKEQTGNFFTKALLFDDPLLRIVSGHTTETYGDYYKKVKDELKFALPVVPQEFQGLFAYVYALTDCLSEKADMGNKAYGAYRRGDRQALCEIVQQIPSCQKKIHRLYLTHTALWEQENKPFGREALDSRYWTLLGRMGVFREKLLAYLAGESSVIEEYETNSQLLYPDWRRRNWSYSEIVSPTTNIHPFIS